MEDPAGRRYDDIWEGILEGRQATEVRDYIETQPKKNPLPHFSFLTVRDRLHNVYKFTNKEIIENLALVLVSFSRGYENRLMLAKQRLAFAKACSIRLATNSPAYQILSHDLIEMAAGAEGPLTDDATVAYNGNNLMNGMIDMEQLFRIMDAIWIKLKLLGPPMSSSYLPAARSWEGRPARRHVSRYAPEIFIHRILYIIKALRLDVRYETIIYMINHEPSILEMYQFITAWPSRDATSPMQFSIIWDRIYFLYTYIYNYDPDWIQENIPNNIYSGEMIWEDTEEDTRDRFLKFIIR